MGGEADIDAEAKDIWRRSGYFCGHEWFEPFGFAEGLEDANIDEAPDLFENSLALVGTVDTVTRQMERLLKRLPIRWLFAWMYNGLTPHDRLMKMIELFWTKMLPRVTGRRLAESAVDMTRKNSQREQPASVRIFFSRTQR